MSDGARNEFSGFWGCALCCHGISYGSSAARGKNVISVLTLMNHVRPFDYRCARLHTHIVPGHDIAVVWAFATPQAICQRRYPTPPVRLIFVTSGSPPQAYDAVQQTDFTG